MTLPDFVPSIAPDIRTTIEAQLAAIVGEHQVRILFAIESGSRAWGFPSPDSDYDVRFVYAHPVDWYLSLVPGRDVIELPISDDLDINGWDLRKALALLTKPNPVLLEWLSSPIRYVWSEDVCERLTDLARRTTHRTACLHHYLRIGETQWSRHVDGREEIKLKKYFYVLRPALAIRWIRLDPETAPPMNLHHLAAGLDLDAETLADIEALLEAKARTREVGLGKRIARLDDLVEREFDWARQTEKHSTTADLLSEADALFRAILHERSGV